MWLKKPKSYLSCFYSYYKKKEAFVDPGFMSCRYLLQCLSLRQWFCSCSVNSKRQCCNVFGSQASHLPERRLAADGSSPHSHPCLHPHRPTAEPRQQNTRAPAIFASPSDTAHTEQRLGRVWPLRSVGKGKGYERGLSCILPFSVVRCKHW